MSEQSLDKLIATLKAEAITEAEAKAQKITEEARKKADQILKSAEAKKKDILQEAHKEAEAIVSKGESALQQASRDLHVAVRNDLLQLLGTVLEQEVSGSFASEKVGAAVVEVIKSTGRGTEVKLSDSLPQEIADYIRQQLQESDDITTISRDDSLLSGLSITKTDEGWSYEITPEEVAAMLREHLIDKWVDILENKQDA